MSIPDTVKRMDGEEVNGYFQALSHKHRRYVLQCLQKYENPMAVADLADEIVRWESESESVAEPSTRDRIYLNLYHRHLPKLAETNLIRFNSNEKVASLSDADDVRPLLDRINDPEL